MLVPFGAIRERKPSGAMSVSELFVLDCQGRNVPLYLERPANFRTTIETYVGPEDGAEIEQRVICPYWWCRETGVTSPRPTLRVTWLSSEGSSSSRIVFGRRNAGP